MAPSCGYTDKGCRPEDGVPDMTLISDIDEMGIMENLRVRYSRNDIYTYTGSILVAVNPYQYTDIYSQDFVVNYSSHNMFELEPHIFAVANAAHTALKRGDGNQSCVISGESGSGKTETTKFILQFLCSVTADVGTWVEHQILEANTVLEAFGNAKTVRNDNSSRFGRFMRVCFDSKCQIRGCIMQDYLLEQSRITFQSQHERNYHVFYQLVAAAQRDRELAERYSLHEASHYRYLRQSGCIALDGVDDAERFDALRLAFSVLHIDDSVTQHLFATLAAVLWLGNIEFQEVDGGERCVLSPEDSVIVRLLCHLLAISGTSSGCSESEITDDINGTADGDWNVPGDMRLSEVLLFRQINVRGNVTDIPLKPHEARENRNAMAKALYSRTFAWLVSQINACTNPGQQSFSFIGVLDIFGFENFNCNSFEQLCINYTNEKLHTFFNHYVFTLEQETYRREGIKFSHIEFSDNSHCLELIEKPPRCILKLLSEECRMPKGSDETFVCKLHQEFSTHEHYVKGEDRRLWSRQFGIVHYAGPVTYTTAGFVDKNRDTQQDTLFELLRQSRAPFIQELAQLHEVGGSRCSTMSSTMSRGTAKGKPTVSDSFRQQLQQLVELLQLSQPWYVRCIKPNADKMADRFDSTLVMDQLRYLGMLDIIRVRRQGYSVHTSFATFMQRYRCVSTRRFWKPAQIKDACKHILNQYDKMSRQWQLGHSLVFLRHSVHGWLEESRSKLRHNSALLLLKTLRGHICRKVYLEKRAAVLSIQRHYRARRQRLHFLRLRRAVVLIQSRLRGMFAREVACALREMKAIDEERQRQTRMEEERRKMEEDRMDRERRHQQEQEEIYRAGEESIRQLERIAQEDLAVMAEISEQMNLKLSLQCDSRVSSSARTSATVNGVRRPPPTATTPISGTPQSTAEDTSNVDLDSLFQFLADVQAHKNSTVSEIEQDLQRLQDTVDSEMEQLCCADTELSEAEQPELPTDLALDNASSHTALSSSPTLSHSPPLSPLPPPPPLSPLPSPPCPATSVRQRAEPIYESVKILTEGGATVSTVSDSEQHHQEPPAIPSVPPPAELSSHRRLAATASSASSGAAAVVAASTGQIQKQQQQQIAATGVRSRRHSSQNGSRMSAEPDDRENRRRQRVERKLQQLHDEQQQHEGGEELEGGVHQLEMLQLAESLFNVHELTSGGSTNTLTRRVVSSAAPSCIPKHAMIRYTQSPTIPTSHLPLQEPQNIQRACNIFSDLQVYIHNSSSCDELKIIQSIIQLGIEHTELRDEIYIQCIRQATDNPSEQSTERVWLVLSLCSVSFWPSKEINRFYVSYLHRRAKTTAGRCLQYINWCLENCKHTHATCRKNPPSAVEVTAMKRLGTIVCRFMFLDGHTRAVDIHPLDSASDVLVKTAYRIGLCSVEGWAIYQLCGGVETHVKSHEYMYDVIASWEFVNDTPQNGNQSSTSDKCPNSPSASNRFLFKRRLFKSTKCVPEDPVEVHLLYIQAVHSVVKEDMLPVSEKVALQLAGLQAQVQFGDPLQQTVSDAYTDYRALLPSRIAAGKRPADWSALLYQAHVQYGGGKSAPVAKTWYLASVMQYPLWGTTQFPVTFKGYWSYGNSLILAVSWRGILILRPSDRYIIVQFSYDHIESVLVHPSENFLSISLSQEHNQQHSQHRMFVFEAEQRDEIGALIASYSPHHAANISHVDNIRRRVQHFTGEDRLRLVYNVSQCRLDLVRAEILRKPTEISTNNFLKNTLRRLHRGKPDRLRANTIPASPLSPSAPPATSSAATPAAVSSEAELQRAGYCRQYWAFSRQPLTHALTRAVTEPDVNEIAVNGWYTVLMFCGLVHSNSSGQLCDEANDERNISLVQKLLDKAINSQLIANELCLQLIKQTTDHPDANSRVNRRAWAMLSLLCSVVLPSQPLVRKYLSAHLAKCGADFVSEEGKYARFAEKCMQNTVCSVRRQLAPSRQEVLCTINCRHIHARFHFMDGQFHSVEFPPSATAAQVLLLVKEKIGLRLDAKGYAVYEVFGQCERNLQSTELIADVMAKWERYQAITVSGVSESGERLRKQHIFLFKKHLLCDETLESDDAVERELLYHQMLHNVRNDKFPLTPMEAVMLTALRAQVELGDHHSAEIDYDQVMTYTLPPRISGQVSSQTVGLHHQSIEGMAPAQAKQAFLNLIQSWPFYRASIFEVVQSFTSNWPKFLWLAVDVRGVHLLALRSRKVFCTYEYDYIVNYSPAANSLLLITGNRSKQSKVILNTSQAVMIASLMADYSEVVRNQLALQQDAIAYSH